MGFKSLKINNININITIKTTEGRHWRRSVVFVVNFEQILHIVLLFLLLALCKWIPPGTLHLTQFRPVFDFLRTWKHHKIRGYRNLFPPVLAQRRTLLKLSFSMDFQSNHVRTHYQLVELLKSYWVRDSKIWLHKIFRFDPVFLLAYLYIPHKKLISVHTNFLYNDNIQRCSFSLYSFWLLTWRLEWLLWSYKIYASDFRASYAPEMCESLLSFAPTEIIYCVYS